MHGVSTKIASYFRSMQAGTYLRSTALLNGTFFENSIILLTEVNAEGAIGFVVNQPFPRRFNELTEYRHSPPVPLWTGGPVDREHLFMLHDRPELIPDSQAVKGNIYYGGDFATAVRLLNNGTLLEKNLRLMIGYCGWDAGELEDEITEGSWTIETEFTLF